MTAAPGPRALNLARKLREMWLRGEPNERENAKDKLDALLAKHGLTMFDLEQEDLDHRGFTIPAGDMDFFKIIAAHYVGVKRFKLYRYKNDTDPSIYYMELTRVEWIELEARFEFFKAAFEKEKELLLRAFIYRQGLTPRDLPRPETPREPDADALKSYFMAQSMPRYSFHSQLGFGTPPIDDGTTTE